MLKVISQDGLHKYEVTDYFVDIENSIIYANRYSGGIVDKIFLGKYENEDLAVKVFQEMIHNDSDYYGYCFKMPLYDQYEF